MAGRIKGKIALISGGARGMGATEARLFCAEGGRVLIGDVLEEEGEKLAAEIGPAAHFTRLDVSDEDHWQAAVSLAESHFGRLDILVNNAGIVKFASLEQTTLEDYRRVIDINQVGCFLGIKTAAPALRRAGGGTIVNISSVAGLEGVALTGSYVASKFAVRGMTKVAAIELGPDNIRVNSVHPGGVNTPMVRPHGVSEEAIDQVPAPFPIPRIGRPGEVAELVLWLASDASSYCTGSEFVIDGGMTAGSGAPDIAKSAG